LQAFDLRGSPENVPELAATLGIRISSMKTTRVRLAVQSFSLLGFCLAFLFVTIGCGGSYGNGGGGGGRAPYITTQPTDQTVTVGQTATFSVVASGTATLSYQWQKNGANISGATSSSYTTPTTTASDNGATFKVTVSNSAGSVTSNAATLTVNAASGAPTIATQPANQTVAAGQTATFTVVASGTAPLSYQWQKNNTNISGATSSSYTTPATTTSDSGSTFDVVVSNSAGSVTSNAATLTVNSSSSSAFPIKLSANKRYFVDANNKPWLMVADAGHHLMPVIGSTTSSIQQYINSRVSQGFNTINVYGMCGGSGTCPTSGAAQDGTLPFAVGNSNATYDLSTPNAAYWSQVDNVINLANQAGLAVLFDPIPWSVNFGTAMENVASPINYKNDLNPPTDSNDYNFGVFLGNRYKSYPNIIWQFGQDFRHGGQMIGTSWVPVDPTFMDYMAQVIAGVASADTNHLFTSQMNYYASYTQQGLQVACNGGPGCTSAFWNPRFGNSNNVSFVYTYYETYDEMLQAYACGPSGPCTIQSTNGTTNSVGGSSGNTPSSQFPPNVMPTILGESNYEGANNTTFLSSNANAFITRQEMWYTMTSGGAGFEFGQVNVNHFDSSPSWTTMLNTTGTQQVRYVAALLNQFNWWTFVPDTGGQVVTAGAGAANPGNANLYNSTHATTTWDGSSTAIIYTPVSTTLTINMSKFSGSVTARWYDPTTGNFSATSCTSAAPCGNTGTMNFATPAGSHSDGTNANDWVLVLQ